MDSGDYSLSFKVKHPFRDPDEIAREIGLVATHKQMAGGSRRTPMGREVAGRYTETYCCFYIKADAPLETTLERVSRWLGRKSFLHRIQTEGAHLAFAIALHRDQLPLAFSGAVLGLASELEIAMEVSIYAERQKRGARVENTITDE